MGNMNIKPSGMVSKSLTGDLLKPAQGKQKTQTSRNIQGPGEVEQSLKKLGDFLKTSLDELRKMTFGDTVAPAFVHASSNTVIGFSNPDSAKAAADANEFLKIHEKASHLD